jgi:hypothetical protein
VKVLTVGILLAGLAGCGNVWDRALSRPDEHLTRKDAKAQIEAGIDSRVKQWNKGNNNGNKGTWEFLGKFAKYDHVEVTGIVEEGAGATVDVATTFRVTPAGMTATPETITETLRREKTVVANAEYFDSFEWDGKDSYTYRWSCKFVKYDDGWRLISIMNGKRTK